MIRTEPRSERTTRERASTEALRRRLRSSPGTTLIELIVVMAVLIVAVSIFSRMIIATAQLRDVNRETAAAAEAARVILERMRNEDFLDVWTLYNADPTDDPVGGAPGNRFTVAGLEPLAETTDGTVGEIILPAVWVTSASGGGGGSTSFGGSMLVDETELVGGTGSSGATETGWMLREDYVDANLGMPRDLNGDSIIDNKDHSEDYILLPVQIRVEWQGTSGRRWLDVYSMLTDLRYR